MTTVSLIGAFLGLALIFVAARVLACYAVIYRRNNLSVVIALLVSGAAIYMWDWVGLWTFIGGTLIGAWTWISEIESANQRLHPSVNESNLFGIPGKRDQRTSERQAISV